MEIITKIVMITITTVRIIVTAIKVICALTVTTN